MAANSLNFISKLIDEAGLELKESKRFSTSTLWKLESVFENTLFIGFLQLIDDNLSKVAKEGDFVLYNNFNVFKAENSNQTLWQVKGNSNRLYILYPHTNYCQCEMWDKFTWKSNESIVCKHLLFAKLSFIAGHYNEIIDSENVFMDRIINDLDESSDEEESESSNCSSSDEEDCSSSKLPL